MNTNIVLKRGAANWVGIVAWRSSLLRAVWGEADQFVQAPDLRG